MKAYANVMKECRKKGDYREGKEREETVKQNHKVKKKK